jgi:hypothetical protein
MLNNDASAHAHQEGGNGRPKSFSKPGRSHRSSTATSPLSEAREAFRHLIEHEIQAKVIITVAEVIYAMEPSAIALRVCAAAHRLASRPHMGVVLQTVTLEETE